jgi:hypothetical protein
LKTRPAGQMALDPCTFVRTCRIVGERRSCSRPRVPSGSLESILGRRDLHVRRVHRDRALPGQFRITSSHFRKTVKGLRLAEGRRIGQNRLFTSALPGREDHDRAYGFLCLGSYLELRSLLELSGSFPGAFRHPCREVKLPLMSRTDANRRTSTALSGFPGREDPIHAHEFLVSAS